MNTSGDRPIFQQIADAIEDAILSGAFGEETQVPSITEFSVTYKINPATALKGINLLVDAGIVYKKRGLGMFVATGAAEKLRNRRRDEFFDAYVKTLTEEAKRLGITFETLAEMLKRGYDND